MKFSKTNNLKYIILTAIVFTGLFYITRHSISKKNIPVVQNNQMSYQISAKEFFGNQLHQELDSIWQNFSKIGITKSRYEQVMQENRQRYLRSDFPGGRSKVSPATISYVQGIMQELGIDPKSITIVGFNDISPAAASERVMYINESEFNQYSEPAKRFVIGHELQHIVHHDNHSRYTLEIMTNNNVSCTPDKKEHPLWQHGRFREKRADVETALRGTEWAQGYVAFAQEWYKRAGNNPGITHPLNKDRIALAQEVLDYLKHQNIA